MRGQGPSFSLRPLLMSAPTLDRAYEIGEAACAGASGRLWRVSECADNGDGLVKDVIDLFENSHIRPLNHFRGVTQKVEWPEIGLFDSRRSVAVKWTLFHAYGLGAPLRVRPTPHGPVWPSDVPLGGEREELRRAKSLAGANPFLCCRRPVSATQTCQRKRRKTSVSRKKDSG